MSEEYEQRSNEELKRLSEMLSDSPMLVTKEWFHSQVDRIKQEKEQASCKSS